MYWVVVDLDLKEILSALILLAGIVALVALSVVLFHLASCLKRVRFLLTDLHDPVQKTAENLSIVSENVVDITDDVAEFVTPALEEAGEVVQNASVVVAAATETVRGITVLLRDLLGLLRKGTQSFESVASAARSAFQFIRVSKQVLPKGKKKKKKLF